MGTDDTPQPGAGQFRWIFVARGSGVRGREEAGIVGPVSCIVSNEIFVFTVFTLPYVGGGRG